MKKFTIDHEPRLCLVALKDIKSGTELRYDYGDKTNLFWRKDVGSYSISL